MFIELIDPKPHDVYRTTDRTKLRIMELGAPGRLTVNLTFPDDKAAIVFLDAMRAEIDRKVEG